jgi:hypothetical protein
MREWKLIMSSIGHPLPEFPASTHGNAEGLLPLVSIGEAIRRVPRNADWHLDTVKDYDTPRASYSPESQASCITTRADIYHPSGRRPFTVREYAALNGIPHTFRFPSRGEINMTDLKKQIGNAVPPLVWKQFMVKVKECLTNFQEGKIDELGRQTALRDVTNSTVNSVTARMRHLSVEAGPSRVKRTLMRRSLSPDPPAADFGTLASDAAEFRASLRSRANAPVRTFIDFTTDDTAENGDTSRQKKRRRVNEGLIDLTVDD